MTDFTMRPREKCAAALTRPRALTHRVSVECLTFRTLLIALDRHDANAPAQDRGQLGVAELRHGAVVEGAADNPPHFHLKGPNSRGSVEIVTLEVIAGKASKTDLAEVKAWAAKPENLAVLVSEWRRLNERE
jgi:hypothetical protein